MTKDEPVEMTATEVVRRLEEKQNTLNEMTSKMTPEERKSFIIGMWWYFRGLWNGPTPKE